MTASIAELIIKLKDDASPHAKQVAGALKRISQAEKEVGSGSAAMQKLTNELRKQHEQLGRVGSIRTMQQRLSELTATYDKARQRVRELGSALQASANPTERMQKAYEKAAQHVKRTTDAISSQKFAIQQAEKELSSFGASANNLVAAENRIKGAVDKATAALRQQVQAEKAAAAAAERSAQRRKSFGVIGGAVAGYAAYRGGNFALDSIQKAADFDIAVRKMRVYTDIKAGEDAGLIAQAKRIGQQTQFSNIDVVHAQAASMQGLSATFSPALKAAVAEGILENVKNYATLMDSNLAEGAETIRTYLATTRKDISSKEKALFEANKATNQIVKMAKLGGMSNDDVQGYLRFALPSATAAGIAPESAMAIGAVLRRAGYRGEEAGVAMRNFSNKFVSPTSGGKAALTAAGLDYNKYINPARALNVDNLITHLGNSLGTAATPALREALTKVVNDPKLLSNPAAFNAAVADAVEGPAKKGKGGNTANRKKAAKAAGKFWNLSAEGIDVQRMLDDLMASNMTLAQLNEFFSGKFGGKAAITQQARDEYNAARKTINEAGNDPNFAAKKAAEVMEGLGGSVENLKGSFENLKQSFGEANAVWLKPLMDGTGKVLDGFSNLGDSAKIAATALGGVAAVVGFTKGTGAVLGGLFGKGGGAEMLMGSATALDGSAAALTRAAVALGGKGTMSDVAGALPDAAGKGGKTGGLLGWLSGFGSRTLKMAGPLLMLEELANTTTQGEDKALADAAEVTKKVRKRYGDKVLKEARDAYQPWYSRTWNLDASDKDDQAYVDKYLASGRGGPTSEMSLRGIASKYPQGAPGVSRIPNAGWTPPSSGGQNYQADVDKAKQAGGEIKNALDVTAAPKLDTSSIAAGIAMVQQFIALMEKAGGMHLRSPTGGQSVRGVNADVGIGAGP